LCIEPGSISQQNDNFLIVKEDIDEAVKRMQFLTPSKGFRSTGCTQNLVSLQQRSDSDTTTNDEDKDDDKMDVCGPEEKRSSSGNPVPAEGRDWFEDPQK
jgi:hypothetical protein